MTTTKSFVFLSALTAAISGLAQTNVASIGPRIAFAEANYDFGRVDSGEVVKHDFVFTNTGDQLLEIKSVQPGCGCTAVGDWDKQVEPGKVGHINIQFNSSGYSGVVHKTVTVTCNQTNQPTVYVGLQGAIWKAFDVVPTYAVFNMLPEHPTNQTQVVRIISNNDDPMTVSDPTSSNPVFKTELKPVKEGKEYELQVSADSSQINSTVSGTITLKTSSPKMPTISLMAFVMMAPLLTVSPPEIALPMGPLASPAQVLVTVLNNGSNSVALSDPTINKEGATLQVKEFQGGQQQQFNLTASFPSGFQVQAGENILARVKTTNPNYPEIDIPIKQPLPPVVTNLPVLPAAASLVH